METKTLSKSALQVIDRYLHFKAGSAICSIPYLNNKTAKNKTTFRAYKGKGSPEEIKDEVEILMIKGHLDENAFSNEALKKFLVDNNLGIECSGFSYHVLDAESISRGHGHLKNHLKFIRCRGLIGKVICSLRPVENCDVATFADDANSRIVNINEVSVGDIITIKNKSMDGDENEGSNGDIRNNLSNERNHILVIHKIETASNTTANVSTKIFYTHSIAYPEDGIYGTGVRQGTIEIPNARIGSDAGSGIKDISKTTDNNSNLIANARWIESGFEGSANRLFLRAQKCKTEIRRLKWF